MLEELAPICLIAYARPEHTQKVLDGLALNDLCSRSKLYAFLDAPRSSCTVESWEATRDILRKANGFRDTIIVERPENFGLARNIVSAVSTVMERHGRAIVLEDDVVPTPGFLDYMNRALERFEHENKVWHISGYTHPIDPIGIPDVYLSRVMNCWGWGSWESRWKHFEKAPLRLHRDWNDAKIRRFNLEGRIPFWRQVEANLSGDIDTWAVFWYASIFENDGLCLHPTHSLVENIGFDGTGENCGINNDVTLVPQLVDFRPNLEVMRFEEDPLARIRIMRYFRTEHRSYLVRKLNRLSMRTFGRNIIP